MSDKIVLTTGCFDVLHVGHLELLEGAVKLGLLVVGINDDESVRKLKGQTRPINKLVDRVRMLKALSCVSTVTPVYATNVAGTIRDLRPDFWVKGSDYTLETLNTEEVAAAKEVGAEIVILPLKTGYSTTETIRKLPPILEIAKHRAQVAEYTTGNGVDLGSSGDPVVPWAIQVELPKAQYLNYNPTRPDEAIQWRGDATNLPFKDHALDFVHASHLLEDFSDWGPVLREWDRVLKPGGYMIIAVPDHGRFRAAVARGQGDNLSHRHESRLGELPEYLHTYETLVDRFATNDPDEYSILFVGRKR